MSTESPDRPESRPASSATPRRSAWYVALPAVALVVGLVLGGLVVGLAMSGDSGSGTEATDEGASAPPTPTGMPSQTLVIPSACAEAAESVREATALLDDGVGAIRDFQRKRIVDLLNQLEDLSRQSQEQAQACSASDVTTPPAPVTTPEEEAAG